MFSSLQNQLQKYIDAIHPRTRKVQLNTALSLVAKAGSMGISILLVPLTIDYLSKTTYGTWLTISSVIAMLTYADLGIGNGLRNKLAEAVSNQDTSLARVLVSTAYGIFGALQLIFILLFCLLLNHVPWQRVLNTGLDRNQLRLVVLITAVAMAIKLVLDLLSYVLLALQESSRVNFINFFANGLTLIATYGLIQLGQNNLIYLATVTAISPILVLLVSGVVLYKHQLRMYRPGWRFIDFAYAKNILSLGYKFFLIQLCFVIVFYTDNFIINYFFGSAAVTTYNVAFRYFMIINTLFGLVVAPYWSAFTEAYIKADLAWMKQTCRYMYKLWAGLVGVVILTVVLAEPVYSLWVGKRVSVPPVLNISLGLFVIITGWNLIASTILSGMGKMRLQLYYALLSATTNIILAIVFGKILGLGISGVVLASTISLLWGAILGTTQAYKLIKGTALGIWTH